MHHDERGHALTTDNAEAAASIDLAVHNFLHWKAAIMPNVQAALAADPDFGFAHVVNGLMLHGARNMHFRDKIKASLDAAAKTAPALNARERLYVQALEASWRGRITEAAAIYELILADNPRDLFAQRLAQMELFWIGEMDWSAAISARIAPHWNADVASHNIHQSCRAFDLEETWRYDEAERLGRQAVERDPTDVWGTHAVAHVMIMQGRHDEGVAWLEGLKDNWSDANQMQLHLWWHRCLFHLERREFDAVVAIYDQWVRNRDLPLLKAIPDLYIDLQNGASLLLRLELRGIDVGDRWAELADLTGPRIGDHTSPFTSAHFAVILAAAGRFDEAAMLVTAMRGFATEDAGHDGALGPRYAAAVIPAAEAAIAHRKGDHEQVIHQLLPARRLLRQMGGSHAQRDLFFLLLADSAIAVGRNDVLAIALQDITDAGFSDPGGRVGYTDGAARLSIAH